jgi:hypothetical protein
VFTTEQTRWRSNATIYTIGIYARRPGARLARYCRRHSQIHRPRRGHNPHGYIAEGRIDIANRSGRVHNSTDALRQSRYAAFMNTLSAARVFRCRALVPAWFVLVGVTAAWSPAPTVPIALVVLVLTVGIAPGLLVGWLHWHPDPALA